MSVVYRLKVFAMYTVSKVVRVDYLKDVQHMQMFICRDMECVDDNETSLQTISLLGKF